MEIDPDFSSVILIQYLGVWRGMENFKENVNMVFLPFIVSHLMDHE